MGTGVPANGEIFTSGFISQEHINQLEKVPTNSMFDTENHNFCISKSPIVSPLETSDYQLIIRPALHKVCHVFNAASSILVPIELLQHCVWLYEVGDLVLPIVEFEEEHLPWPVVGRPVSSLVTCFGISSCT